MHLKISKVFFLILVVFFVSCDEKRYFDDYKNLDGKWSNKEDISFSFEQNDSINLYNMFVNIRNNNDYPFNNLFLIVKINQPDNVIKIDTLQFEMTKPDGTLLGEGITDTKHNKLWYKENYKFPLKGKYRVTIEQANRESGKINGTEVLEGVTEVGFRIEKK